MLLQSCVQPVIKLRGQRIRQVKCEPSEGRSLIPSPAVCKNLAVPVQNSCCCSCLPDKVSIETSISNTAKTYSVPEKKLRQGLKGVKYQSGSQRRR